MGRGNAGQARQGKGLDLKILEKPVITVTADELIFDESIYPRRTIDRSHVTALADAMTMGSELPPIVIDQRMRIVDGLHRWKAHQRLFGESAKIQAEQNVYTNEAETLLAATEFNERHGLRLESFECTDVAIRLRNMHITPARIAIALHIPAEKVEKILIVRTATSTIDVHASKLIALKRSMSSLAGMELTPSQEEANESAPGASWVVHINQLNKALKAGLGISWGLETKEYLATTLTLLRRTIA